MEEINANLEKFKEDTQEQAHQCLGVDQLSQAHFSPDTVPADGVTQEKIDSDRRAVKRLYSLIFDVVESLGKFQVIVTDHPD